MADKLCGLAEEDEGNGRMLSAGEKYNRAATYYLTCERLQAHGAPGRTELYQRFLQTFKRGIELSRENCERVEIPYEGKHLSGLAGARRRRRAGPRRFWCRSTAWTRPRK